MSSVEERALAAYRKTGLVAANVALLVKVPMSTAEMRAYIERECATVIADALRAEHAHCLAELRQSNTPVTMSAEMLDRLLRREREKAARECAEMCDDTEHVYDTAGRGEEAEGASMCASDIRARFGLTTPEPSDAAG